MQLVVPYRYGQVKPYGSIPRVNRAHPLASKLSAYVYGTSNNFVDLINGGSGVINVGASGHVTNSSSKYGTGLKFTGTAAADCVGMPLVPAVTNWTNVASGQFSFAAGFMNTGAPITSSTVAGTGIAGGAQGVAITIENTTTTMGCDFDNGASQFVCAAGTASLNAYHTLLACADTNAAGRIYANGTLDQNISASTLNENAAGQQICINSGDPSSNQFGGGVQGFVYYYAQWNRALTATEAKVLHYDPYCFLIYPEDEMFATWVGSSFIDALQSQIWL